MASPRRLDSSEVASAFDSEDLRRRFPPVLSLRQFADLFQVSVRTAKHWIATGDFKGATTRAGKHRRIWRDLALQIAFSRERTAPRQAKTTRSISTYVPGPSAHSSQAEAASSEDKQEQKFKEFDS